MHERKRRGVQWPLSIVKQKKMVSYAGGFRVHLCEHDADGSSFYEGVCV